MSQPVYKQGANAWASMDATKLKVNVTVPNPERGDVIIAFLANHAPYSIGQAITPPDPTWKQIYQGDANCTDPEQRHRLGIFWKRVDTDITPSIINTFTRPNDDGQFMASYSLWGNARQFGDVMDPAPVGVTVTVAADANVSVPAFLPLTTDALIIYMAYYATRYFSSEFADFGTLTPNTNPVSSSLAAQFIFMPISTGGVNNGFQTPSRTWPANPTVNAGSTGLVFALAGVPLVPANYQRAILRDGMQGSIG